jgi:solute carrier family 13 (sodium-dependent dicarboxylate transporter), member 2/3/5
MSRLIKIIAGPLAAILIYLFFDFGAENHAAQVMASIVIWMAIWWITEAVNISVTALLPVVLFPLLGLMDTRDVASLYMNQVIFLFIGGFVIAFAMERWNLHRRIALKIILSMKGTPSMILFGFMFVSYFLSMWMSNTATVLMLLPAVLAIISQLDNNLPGEDKKYAIGFLLGLAYAGSIGGTGTLVGTPPNLILMGFYQEMYPGDLTITFSRWFMFGLPVSFTFLLLAFFVLKRMFLKELKGMHINLHDSEAEYKKLGRATFEEKTVGIIFVITAFLWLFREDIDLGFLVIPGWSNLFSNKQFIQDSTVAIVMAILLFLIPTKSKKGDMIMNWDYMKKLPYGIILLFGGGFALAKGFEVTGLSNLLAGELSVFDTLPLILIIFGLCMFMTFFTEFTSNSASIQLILPVIYALTLTMDVNPLLIMIPVTFAASFAFMMPIATPPNAIIFGSNRLKISDMAKTGLILNFIGIILITLAMITLGRWVFGI